MPALMAPLISIWIRCELAVSRTLAREHGQAVVEYALILALLMVVALAATRFLGSKVTSVLSTVAGSV
jgi:Flp pilus assembly pilin Flp